MLSPPPPGRHAVAFILVTAALDVLALGIIIPVLPQLVAELAGSSRDAGFLNGVFVAIWALAQFIAAPAVGALSDRYGRRPVLLVSALGLGADYLLLALAPNLWWLALGRALSGVTGASFSIVYAYMADVTPPEGRARAFGLIGAAWSGGFIAGPLLGGLLGELSPRAPFWVAAALSGAAFIYGYLVLPETLPPELRRPFSWRRANPFGALRLLRSRAGLPRLAIVLFLLDAGHHVFSAVYVLYAGDRYGWSATEIGVLLAVVGALDVAVQGALVGPVVRRIGERATLVLGTLGGAVGLAAMGLAPTGLGFALAVLPNALWGLALPTLQSAMTARVSASEQGELQGATTSVGSLAGIGAPPLFGAIYGLAAGPSPTLSLPGAPFLAASLVLVIAAALSRRLGSVPRRPSRPE